MADLQARVQQLVDDLVGSGRERGVQVAVYVDGELVVDVVAGLADSTSGRAVEPGTVFHNWSIGKGVTSTLVHQAVDAGLIGYDTPLAELWPEFARHGKDAVTVRQVLTHTAGLPQLPPGCTVDDVCDWSAMTAALEDAVPWWEPGTAMGYHAYTFGFLAGEVVRRATGRELGDVLREDLVAPLGLPGEIWFGVPDDEVHRLATLQDAPSDLDPASLPADLPMLQAVPLGVFPAAALGNDPRVLAADIPAGAKVSARAIAGMYAALAGEVDGTRLVSAERLADLSAVGSSGEDRVMGGDDARWGLGYALGLPFEGGGQARVVGMAGAGGSWAGVDLDRRIALAVTKNLMTDDFATVEPVARLVFSR